MELGEKLKQARMELGLSQRQLCGDVITRNMLSLIENGLASPSMDTLRYLAGQLEKPVSYFLDESGETVPNYPVMEKARNAYDRGDYKGVLQALEPYRTPDPVFDREVALLKALALLNLAEEAVLQKKVPYALELLNKAAEAGAQTPYYTGELERRRLLLQAQLVPTQLPVDDRELLLRAEAALRMEQPEEARRYLEAAQIRTGTHWNYLRGKVYLAAGDYAMSQTCFEAAWDYDPMGCAVFLEQCCRELEDFKGAYHYACFLRGAMQ